MTSIFRNMKLISHLLLLLAIISLSTQQEWCPSDCHCQTIDNQNHAKCLSIQGLLEGKNLPIHIIDLSNANLTKLSHLEKLRDLTAIDASYNQLSDIDHLGKRVKYLNLSHNKITSAKLANIPKHVENLDLSYNEITYLPLELTINLKKLKRIELIGNKINCTCETLEVRNWFQSVYVSTNNFIKCSYPVQFKDLPWLQVKQKELCDDDVKTNEDDENELMLGDQPILNEGSLEKESVEELDKDFLPVAKKVKKETTSDNLLVDGDEDDGDDDVEGSGGGSMPQMARLKSFADLNNEDLSTVPNDDDDSDNGSGSGGGIIDVPHLPTGDDDQETTPSNGENDYNETSQLFASTSEQPTEDTVTNDLGISKNFESEQNSTNQDDDALEVTENTIIPIYVPEMEKQEKHEEKPEEVERVGPINLEPPNAHIKADDNGINQANATGENRGTYILLGIILFAVIALILFVAIKRIKRKSNNDYDEENPRETELADMDKKNLGKPIQNNGNGSYEHKPLISDKAKDDFAKPVNGNNNNNRKIVEQPDHNIQEPLLNNNNNNNNMKPTDELDIKSPQSHPNSPQKSPRYGHYPPQKSPRSTTTSPNTSGNDDDVPSSPRQGRYSPVYSPETGKVKIKLTETAKPKTPMLVTRSRSNAGDLVLTTPTVDIVDTK